MRALIMFVAPIVAAVATATLINQTQITVKSLPHHKCGVLAEGDARWEKNFAPELSMTFHDLGYSRELDNTIVQLSRRKSLFFCTYFSYCIVACTSFIFPYQLLSRCTKVTVAC
jgi:hypothetical protein